MSAPFSTIAVDPSTWDLTLDAAANIELRIGADAVAQDMSSAVRLFKGEYIYDANAGVPYDAILGESPSLSLMKADFIAAAQTVPGTSNVKCFISGILNRRVEGQIQATVTTTSNVVAAPFVTT